MLHRMLVGERVKKRNMIINLGRTIGASVKIQLSKCVVIHRE